MSQIEKPMKISKQLRLRAQEFLICRNNSEILQEIVHHFDCGADQLTCLLTLELIFSNLLKDRDMFIELIPLKPVADTPENQYKHWLRNLYGEVFMKILGTLENSSCKVQTQGLSTAMSLLSYEGRYPLETKESLDNYVPLNKLKLILMKILSNKQNNTQLVNKYTEYLLFDDILFFTWKILPSLTAKSNPNEIYIMNYLFLLEKLQVHQNLDTKILCGEENATFFTFDEAITVKCLNKIWHCVMHWEHTPQTHKQMLIVLLERILTHLEKPLLLTDFLMDSLDVGGPISLLALQGIFTMIQVHNLDYPNIFTKLYSMFEPEIFHTKYKARLFYLSDLFLSSTHLPENLVAAFAKRMARLALIAPSEDIIIICHFILNLIVRHPGLKCLLNNTERDTANTDPYIMEERDPIKSNAINSSLWEIKTLQNHVSPSVSSAAKFINTPLPSVEWDLSKVLDKTGDDMFDKEVKKFSKLIVLQFDKPNGASIEHKKLPKNDIDTKDHNKVIKASDLSTSSTEIESQEIRDRPREQDKKEYLETPKKLQKKNMKLTFNDNFPDSSFNSHTYKVSEILEPEMQRQGPNNADHNSENQKNIKFRNMEIHNEGHNESFDTSTTISSKTSRVLSLNIQKIEKCFKNDNNILKQTSSLNTPPLSFNDKDYEFSQYNNKKSKEINERDFSEHQMDISLSQNKRRIYQQVQNDVKTRPDEYIDAKIKNNDPVYLDLDIRTSSRYFQPTPLAKYHDPDTLMFTSRRTISPEEYPEPRQTPNSSSLISNPTYTVSFHNQTIPYPVSYSRVPDQSYLEYLPNIDNVLPYDFTPDTYEYQQHPSIDKDLVTDKFLGSLNSSE